uniref:Uncharacterized protein n=1 Tax=Parascaris equorum TaxID=6256 RepID=A0A914RJ76_PAREQ
MGQEECQCVVRIGWNCEEPVEEHSSLGMEKVSGLFVLLGFGLCLALLVALCEKIFMITVMRSYQRRQSKRFPVK